jgi:hypothetical protein
MLAESPIYQLLFLVAFFILWFVLMRFILPRLGVST